MIVRLQKIVRAKHAQAQIKSLIGVCPICKKTTVQKEKPAPDRLRPGSVAKPGPMTARIPPWVRSLS
jgi:hypothetical protein